MREFYFLRICCHYPLPIRAIQRDGMTLIPLKLYFNKRGIAKIELGLGKGKKLHDKRETQKKRDWDRQKARIMREQG